MRKTDEARESARLVLSEESFLKFDRLMTQYHVLIDFKRAFLNRESILAWYSLMTYFEEEMHSLYPPIGQPIKRDLPQLDEWAETQL